ncbi:MAG: substrate-binding domain-containing protein [Proteobacteria bacterium]|nr:substrate-binding domain-containing protein [Pseudomonadota bacterium]
MIQKKCILAFLILLFMNSLLLAAEIKIVGGSTSIKTVLEPIKPAFEKETGIKLVLIPAGSKKAIVELDNGNCDAASAAHSLKDLISELEKENIKIKNLPSLKSNTLSKETVYSVIVNESNPLKSLTKDQLKSIFTGKIKNWNEVGGNNLPISVIWGKLAEGTKIEVKKRVLDNEEPIESAVPTATTDNSIINIVSNDPKAIAVVANASIGTQKVKILNTPEIKSNPIILVTLGEPNKLISLLIDFIRKEGHKYIKNQ